LHTLTIFFPLRPPPPPSTLFPYTTLFRSQLDKSYGADGMAVRNDIASIKDLKGKTVAASAPGTSPYFGLAWMLKKNGQPEIGRGDRKSTRLNSSHSQISYAVFCLKKKKKK